VDVEQIPFYVCKPHRFRNGAPAKESLGAKIDQASIGSCSNGRLEDIAIVSRILKGRKVAPGVRCLVCPGSYAVLRQCLDAGILQDILDAGAQLVSPGCGTCRAYGGYLIEGEVSITTATRNHKGRMGSVDSFLYLGGPATVAASAIAGEITDPTEVLREIGLI
jgi:3-isopropylmalate/(R)-2-methylmalate dehydratase large subunit